MVLIYASCPRAPNPSMIELIKTCLIIEEAKLGLLLYPSCS